MSNLSDLMPAGASGKTITATDSGSGITAGRGVILESDGDVTQVAEAAASTGSFSGAFNSANTANCAAAYDTVNDKVLVVYKDSGNSNYPTMVVGTVGTKSVSWSGETVINSSGGGAAGPCVAYDTNGEAFCVLYSTNPAGPSPGYVISVTISGTTPSTNGSAATLDGTGIGRPCLVYDESAQKTLAYYGKWTAGEAYNGGAGRICTVTTSSVTVGGEQTIESAPNYVGYANACYDSGSSKTILFYNNGATGWTGGRVCTCDGSTISFGAISTGISDSPQPQWPVYASVNDKVVNCYSAVGDSNQGKATVGTVSGTTISFATPVVWSSDSLRTSLVGNAAAAVYDPSSGRIVVCACNGDNSDNGYYNVGTVSGTTTSWGTFTVLGSAQYGDFFGGCYDPDTEQVVYALKGSSDYGKGIVFDTGGSNATTANFLGIADETISASASGAIVVQGGTSAQLTGLTIGSNYYVQEDGTFATSAGLPSIKAGIALSATQLLLNGDS